MSNDFYTGEFDLVDRGVTDKEGKVKLKNTKRGGTLFKEADRLTFVSVEGSSSSHFDFQAVRLKQ
jgi:hypothetical protein